MTNRIKQAFRFPVKRNVQTLANLEFSSELHNHELRIAANKAMLGFSLQSFKDCGHTTILRDIVTDLGAYPTISRLLPDRLVTTADNCSPCGMTTGVSRLTASIEPRFQHHSTSPIFLLLLLTLNLTTFDSEGVSKAKAWLLSSLSTTPSSSVVRVAERAGLIGFSQLTLQRLPQKPLQPNDVPRRTRRLAPMHALRNPHCLHSKIPAKGIKSNCR